MAFTTRKGFLLPDTSDTRTGGDALTKNFTFAGDEIEAIGFVSPGTDNIQPAIDALPSTGGIIRLKPGTHTIATTVLINKSDIVIEGPRAAKVVTTIAATDKFLFLVATGTNRVTIRGFSAEVPDIGTNGAVIEASGVSNEISIESLRIETTSVSPNGCAIRIIGTCNDWTIRNCFIKGRFADGIDQRDLSSTRMLVADCSIDFIDSPANTTSMNLRGPQVIVRGCIFTNVINTIFSDGPQSLIQNCSFTNFRLGPRLKGVGSLIVGCYAQLENTANPVFGFSVDTGGDDCAVIGCTVDGNSNSGAISTGITLKGARSKASGCRVFGLGAVKAGVDITGVDVHSVGCSITDCSCPGVLIEFFANFAHVSGNKIKACTNGVETADTDGLIAGNHFRGNTGTEILETGSADFNFVHGNFVRGGTITIIGAGSVQSDNFT